MATYSSTFALQAIYVYRINDAAHAGCLKVGQVSAAGVPPGAAPNSPLLVEAARRRINRQTLTAGVAYELLHTELTLVVDNHARLRCFNDKEVHDVLLNSGVRRKAFATQGRATEWFETDLATVRRAIAAAKEGRRSLAAGEVTADHSPIVFRPEQREAIDRTVRAFRRKTGRRMLWNAKMRFGKTLCALQVAREADCRRTLIVTHRPVVDEGWRDDFRKIFHDRPDWHYCDRASHAGLPVLERRAAAGEACYVCFASLQDLRGSRTAGGKYDKNGDIFSIAWDLLIIDEAHEGTQTDLGRGVIELLHRGGTRLLQLSGTPFNLLDGASEDEVFTWDYVMEQRAKAEWDERRPGEHNPYAALPALHIYTYYLGELAGRYGCEGDDGADVFNFREFFRTLDGDGARFAHEADVRNFLDLLCRDAPDTLYPFARQDFRDNFRHTLWVVPGVKEARALSRLLQAHPVFGMFNIANVAGPGDEEEKESDALAKVRAAVTDSPEDAYSVTLTCGRLTTGVSVREWTAVLMLSGQASTSAAAYMQTIFRVQTPAAIAGRVKTDCYAFDFAPDRTLRVLAEAAGSGRAGRTEGERREALADFLRFCPVISCRGSAMRPLDTPAMMQHLKRAYVERVVSRGFETDELYNDALWTLDDAALRDFEHLRGAIGETKAMGPMGSFVVNSQGLAPAARRKGADKASAPAPATAPDRERQRRALNRRTAIGILRGVSIRLPLIIYGAALADEDAPLTPAALADLVDARSWAEFMPAGVTKRDFRKFARYYDEDVFAAAARRIRRMALAADSLGVEARVARVAEIFSLFRNPDKETVLTPWRVVNLHLASTLGGWRFWDGRYATPLAAPRPVPRGDVTARVFSPRARVLEVNSKSGLYALYVAYSIYRSRLREEEAASLFGGRADEARKSALWRETVGRNVFVLCATPLAAAVTRRTLLGFDTAARANIRCLPGLPALIKGGAEKAAAAVRAAFRLTKGKTSNEADMKFDAVVGNPPYQITTAKKETRNGQKAVTSVFQHFQNIADVLGTCTSLIYPGKRWIQRSGKGMADFGLRNINDPRLSKLVYYPDATELFGSVGIADGLSIVFKDARKVEPGFEYVYCSGGESVSVRRMPPGEEQMALCPLDESVCCSVASHMRERGWRPLCESVFSRKLFSVESDFVETHPGVARLWEEGMSFDPSREVRLLTNDRAGKAGRARWYVVDRSLITTGLDVLDAWKVIVSSANAGGQKRRNQIEVVEPHCAFGRARIALKSFATETEARNFLAYCCTELVRFMFLMTDEALNTLAQLVPDIGDYSETNGVLDFHRDLDTQLYRLFGIDDSGRRHIRQVLAKYP